MYSSYSPPVEGGGVFCGQVRNLEVSAIGQRKFVRRV